MYSSYKDNDFGTVLYNMVTVYPPAVAVELGVLEGYSTYHIARGLRKNHEVHAANVKLDAYDLFENYPHRHSTEDVVKKNLKDGLSDWVNLEMIDAYKVHDKYEDGSVYFLHVDLSNTGMVLRRIIQLWDRKMVIGGMICFEGGSEERDNVEWMKKYNAAPIRDEVENNPTIQRRYVYCTYLKYPSMTVFLKKRDD